MRIFLLMVQFFTRIPVNKDLMLDEKDFAKGVKYFPLIGLIVGIFNAAVYVLFKTFSSGILPIIMSILANVLITGALHIDGLADTCDGIFSSRSRERMLQIMKDSRIGTNGTAAIFFDLALRIGLLASINENHILKSVVISSVISRTVMGLLICISRKSEAKEGLGSLFVGKVHRRDAVILVILGSVLSLLIFGWISLTLILAAIAAACLYRNYILYKVGVMTGDTLGAANELLEVIVLIIINITERHLMR